MTNIFLGVWLGITLPIFLFLVFELLEPIVIADSTGMSMIIIGLLIGVLDGYIGMKIINKIQLRFKKGKGRGKFFH